MVVGLGLGLAILALVAPLQGKIATGIADASIDRSLAEPESTSRDSTVASSTSSTLTALARQVVGDLGSEPPPVWHAAGVSVTAVAPPNGALDVTVSTNVSVTFSRAVDPLTVTPATFRLLAPGAVPVPAQVSVGPLALQATLNPDAALGFGQVYTVQVTEGVQAAAGGAAEPFSALFATAAEPPVDQLPAVADQAEPPPNATQAKTGSAVASAGDLNGDGVDDYLAGAPGLQVGDQVEAGAVLLYLGSASATDRAQADVIFEGIAAHDRTGVSVAGNFDFNADGVADILIGAEQVNRTAVDDPVAGCNAGTPCGGGKVYLIYFDPTDVVHYPNLSNPAVADVVDLSLVGTEIPGVVFTGNFGDQVGFAVAGGGRFDPGAGQDIAIGAPGADPGDPPRIDAGVAYVIFDDPALSGTVSLDRVASGQPDQVDGVVYLGAAAGDHLGYSIAFPGDVTGTVGDDLAIGAPGADRPLVKGHRSPQAEGGEDGVVFVPEGGTSVPSIIESSDVGSTKPGSVVEGDQDGMELGSSVDGGGDNLVDGEADLLMGAPGYDSVDELGDPLVDSGLVAQTSSKLPYGTFTVYDVGSDPTTNPDALGGVIYTGEGSGDALGTSVTALGDVTGDGFDDVAFGAPLADPLVDGTEVTDAGTIYEVDGYVPSDTSLGTVDVGEVGDTVAGTQLVGTTEGEQAGASLSDAGDLDADGDVDYLVGAPERDAIAPDDGAGTVYVVLESEPVLPGSCGSEGCVVADLETGAQIVVPSGSLSEATGLAVKGLLDPMLLPVGPPVGQLLLGAADFDPEGQVFGASLPTLHVPGRPELAGQLTAGEALDLWFYSAGSWIDSGIDGVVEGNPHYPGFPAVRADVGILHLYAAFLADGDGDGYRDSLDSQPLDPFVCADTDGDACDDCSSGNWAPASDGPDTDADGQCDAGDADDDNDGVADPADADPLSPSICADADGDGCDDCAVGTDGFGPLADNLPANDGTDTDADGACDASDDCTDVDGDGVGNGNLLNAGCAVPDTDANDGDPSSCLDSDGDLCDDCTSGTWAPAGDGTDTDADGQCDAGDADDDNDGVADGVDCAPVDATVWALPSEAGGLATSHSSASGITTLTWSAPSLPGTSLAMVYDVLRSGDPADFLGDGACVETHSPDESSEDPQIPTPGSTFYYLVRPTNACGAGALGADSSGRLRGGVTCL